MIYTAYRTKENWNGKWYGRSALFTVEECLAAKKRPFTNRELEILKAGGKLAGYNVLFIFSDDSMQGVFALRMG